MKLRAGSTLPRVLLGLSMLAAVAGGSTVYVADASPASTTTTASAGHIIYIAADGATIAGITPNGTGLHSIYTVHKAAGEVITGLSADPSGQYLLYSVGTEEYSSNQAYYLLHNGATRRIPSMFRMPRWSPDGKHFVGQTETADGTPGKAYVYNITNSTYLYLPFTGMPDWFPDGTKYVYTDQSDVYAYNRTTGATTRLTHLPHNENGSDWAMDEAHVLPDGKHIAFFGQEIYKSGQYQLGASGNGLQWYWLPVAGGAPQPWLDPEGNGLIAYSASSAVNKVVYAASGHDSACASVENITVVHGSLFPGHASNLNLPGLNDNTNQYVDITGLSWSPDGTHLVYGVIPYSCPDAGQGQVQSKPVIYTSAASGQTTPSPVKLVNGTNPVWTR